MVPVEVDYLLYRMIVIDSIRIIKRILIIYPLRVPDSIYTEFIVIG
jgi:hypothetical protein